MAATAHKRLRLVAAGKLIPRSEKLQVEAGGDDAFFVTSAGFGALGVADGGSAWAGAAPTVAEDCARSLMKHCTQLFEQDMSGLVSAAAAAAGAGPDSLAQAASGPEASNVLFPDPSAVMVSAQVATNQPGSVTAALLAALQPGGKLAVASLGDCKLLLLRKGAVVDETEPHVYGMAKGDTPYQLSHPDFTQDGTRPHTVKDAGRYSWDVQDGDILIAGSDGLFDNLWQHHMLPLAHEALSGYTNAAQHLQQSSTTAAKRSTSGGSRVGSRRTSSEVAPTSDGAAATATENEQEYVQAAVGRAAELLAAAAARNAGSSWVRVPAAAAKLQRTGKVPGCLCWLQHRGGKVDDITCVVALVTSRGTAVMPEVTAGSAVIAVPAVTHAASIGGTQETAPGAADAAAMRGVCAAAGVTETSCETKLDAVCRPDRLLPDQWVLTAQPDTISSNLQRLQQQQQQPPSKSSTSIKSSSNYKRSSRSYGDLYAAAGSARAASSAAGSNSSCSDKSVPLPSSARASSYDGKLRLIARSAHTGSAAGSTIGGFSTSYFAAPALGDSPTYVKQLKKRQSASRLLGSTASGSTVLMVTARVKATATIGDAVAHAAADKGAAAVVAAAEPADLMPAGTDSLGNQLHVGNKVAVVTEQGVAAVGRVKLLPGQKLDKWLQDKVCPEHVGVGELHVGWEMEAVARQARFWVKMEGHDIYGNHPAYTFWSKRKVLMEKGGINISIPCSSLKRLD